MSTTLTLTNTLTDDARQQLEPWLEETATLARSQCSEHDFSGALTLVATDPVWAQYPGNVTNMADVIANGDFPGAIDAAATAAEVMLYKHSSRLQKGICVRRPGRVINTPSLRVP